MSASENESDATVRAAIAAGFVVSTIGPAATSSLVFSDVRALCLDVRSGDGSILAADPISHAFYRCTPHGEVRPLTGYWFGSSAGFECGPAAMSRFVAPVAIRVDPSNANRIYLVDQTSVRVWERTPASSAAACIGTGTGTGIGTGTRTGTSTGATAGGDSTDRATERAVVSLIAGGAEERIADGIGSHAGFDGLSDLVCTSDGRTLLVCDASTSIRSIDVQTREVTTVAGSGSCEDRNGFGLDACMQRPRQLAFDRTTPHKPDSVIYVACEYVIARFDRLSGELRAIPFVPALSDADLFGIACAADGTVLFSCLGTNSVYALNPTTGEHTLIAGTGPAGVHVALSKAPKDGSALTEARFTAYGLCLNEHTHSLLIADSAYKSIRSLTLPPHLFTPPPSPLPSPPPRNTSQ